MNDLSSLHRQPRVTPGGRKPEHISDIPKAVKNAATPDPVEATLWPSPNGSEALFRAWGPGGDPRKRTTRPAPPSDGSVSRLDVRADWHELIGSTRVRDAAADLASKLDTARAAVSAVHSLDEDHRRAQGEAVAALRSDPGAEVHVLDLDAERLRRQAAWEVAYADAADSSRRYRATTASEVRRLLPKFVDGITARRAKALKAVDSIRADVEKAAAAMQAVHLAETEMGVSGAGTGWHRFAEGDGPSQASSLVRHLEDLAQSLARTDDAATGRWVLDQSTTVPLHTRKALSQASGDLPIHLLEQAELADIEEHGKSLTAYTDPRQRPEPDPELTTWISERRLPR